MYLLFSEEKGFISYKREFFSASKEVSFMVEKANECDRQNSTLFGVANRAKGTVLAARVFSLNFADQTEKSLADIDVTSDSDVSQHVTVEE